MKAEAALNENAAKFDTFLKENDEKVQAALRKADAESKAKQEKVRAHAPVPVGPAHSHHTMIVPQNGTCCRS